MNAIKTHIATFEPVSLADVDAVKLMKRVDTKFIVNKAKLPLILDRLNSIYSILEIEKKRLMSYETQYYDTEKLCLYNAHHSQRKVRFKVRVREYIESNISFIEVKKKTNTGQTVKKRIKVDKAMVSLNDVNVYAASLMNNKYKLVSSLTNSFNRFTLVKNDFLERVTFDLNIAFNNNAFNNDLVIIELKQEKLDRSTLVFQLLKELAIYPSSISKYCIGVASVIPDTRKNNFKPIFRKIHKTLA